MINILVLFLYEILRMMQKVFQRSKNVNDEHNIHVNDLTSDSFIENQHALKDIPYGKADMAGCGCEVIAVYNAELSLGKNCVSLHNLISEFKKDGIVLNGKWGTAPKAIRDYLKRAGYTVLASSKEKDFDQIAEKSDTVIVTFFNDKRDVRKEIHTVCLTKNDGKYMAHNVYCNGKVMGPYESISEFIMSINAGYARGIYINGVIHC